MVLWVVAWLSGNAIGLDLSGCSTSGPVSTRMGDRPRAGKPSQYVASRLGRLSVCFSVVY